VKGLRGHFGGKKAIRTSNHFTTAVNSKRFLSARKGGGVSWASVFTDQGLENRLQGGRTWSDSISVGIEQAPFFQLSGKTVLGSTRKENASPQERDAKSS